MAFTTVRSFDVAPVDKNFSISLEMDDPLLFLLNDEDASMEDPKVLKRRQHRVEMVAFRRKRKEKQNDLHSQHVRLEKQVKQITTNMRTEAATPGTGETGIVDTLRTTCVEIEALRQQNAALRKQIGLHTSLQQAILEASACQNEQEEAILPTTNDVPGWRVHFASGGRSFHFHPFEREVFDGIMESSFADLSTNPPAVSLAGEFLGWKVHHATVASRLESKSLVARARFTKRINCSLRFAFDAMSTEAIEAWPLIVTPMNWSGDTTDTVVLQKFHDNSSVLVRDIKGNVNLRYICLTQRSRWTERDGKRTYAMVIADSEANRRSRSADTNQGDVEWITEGETHLTLVEVDGKTIDVVYDHWSQCHGKLHAQYLFVQWAHYAFRWEQMVVPTKLLHS